MANSSLPLSRTGFVLFAWCAVLCNGAFAVYLPEIGPARLRFQATPDFVATVAMLPPLKMTEILAATTVETAQPDPSNAPADVPGTLATIAEETSPEAMEAVAAPPTTAQAAPPVAVQATPVITPQMFVQFFKSVGANTNLGASVIVPGAFLPPQASPAPASSSATYNLK